MCRGIEAVRPGARLGDIGYVIQSYVESENCSVVREYCGHGIGRGFHEDPQVLHYGRPGTGLALPPGMTITVEPMVNAGRRHVKLLPDGWTVVTKDHSLSAQWEHTVLVTEARPRSADTRSQRRDMSAQAAGAVPEVPPTDAALDAHLARGERPVDAFRRALTDGRKVLETRFLAGEPVEVLVQARAQMLDALLVRAWPLLAPDYAPLCSLVAVGGYGRGELHPASDVDIMVLRPEAGAAGWEDTVARFVSFLWDIGLEVGHSVRTVAECGREARADLTVATSLMESRLLAGPAALYAAMCEATSPAQMWPSREFFEAKLKEQQERHHRFDDTAYNLEPNVKSGPGGLRDIQLISWVTQRHFGTHTLEELASYGFLTEEEYASLLAGRAFLWKVRFGLHMLAGRREDRLVFDTQVKLARLFGYEDASYTLAVEQLMQRYYRTVMELSRLIEMLLQLLREAIVTPAPEAPTLINERFQVRHGYLETRSDEVFRQQPAALLELFLIMQEQGNLRGVSARTIRLIRANRYLIDEEFRQNPRHHRMFLSLLRAPVGVTHELRRMNLYGILGLYMPAFGRIVGRMQYDLFHAYTVDAHTLFVVSHLRRFMIRRSDGTCPYCSDIMQALPKPELAYLAALFHDIAKGRGGDHSELGAVDAEAFCLEQGLGRYDARLVAWLVSNHLLLSVTAQKKDIADPEVINEFARIIGDQTHLDYLYVLTVADVRATNPKLWNSWKASLFSELYEQTRRALRRGLENPDRSRRAGRGAAGTGARAAARARPRRRGDRCGVGALHRRLLPAPRTGGDRVARTRADGARRRRHTRTGRNSRADRTRRYRRVHLHAAPAAQLRHVHRRARRARTVHSGCAHHRCGQRLQPGHLRRAGSDRRADTRPGAHDRDRRRIATRDTGRQ